jgi:ADP-dependent phosphofructokinase/glucokinase
VSWYRLYSDAVDNFRSRLPSSKGVAVAFNTNLDGIINLGEDRLGRLLHAHPDISDQAFLGRDSPPGRVDGPLDFLTGLMHFMERGSGGEYMIHDPLAYDWIVSHLPIDEYRMGGNAGIMANALASLGARFVVPNVVQLPQRQAAMFLDRDNILLPIIEGGKVTFSPPRTAAREDRELVHLILEYREGTSFEWKGEWITSPRNNRYIVNADDFNGKIVVDPAFVEGIREKVMQIDKFILTGLHMLKRAYPDGATHLDRLTESLDLVARWKEMNPEMRVHFELADIQDPVIRGDVLSMSSRVADSVGMNEDELQTVTGKRDLLTAGPEAIVDAMSEFTSRYVVGRVLLHSRDFVLSLVEAGYGVDPEVVRDSQMLGVLTSQYRAYTGDFGTPDDLQGLVDPEVLEPAPSGLDLYRRFGSLGEGCGPGVWPRGDAWVVFTPCLLSRTTRNTVGLGDCLAAGSILGEIST